MGTSHSDPCNFLVKEMWEWCIARRIWISAAHIPGKNNLIADFESRRNQRESEWQLDKVSLCNALETLGFKPDVDLFASRISHQFPKYVSFRPDPEAFAIDAFSLDWSNLKFYAFPPFSVIPTVLSKLKCEGAMGVCLLPDWPTQAWYPATLQLLRENQYTSRQGKICFSCPATRRKLIQSGTSWTSSFVSYWTSINCHNVQKTCLWLHGGKVPPSNTKLTLPNGNSTVKKGTLIFLNLV